MSPEEGKPATDRTEIRILYDDNAIYIGAAMYSSRGEAGVSTRLTRRDQLREGDTDMLSITLDTFHDHLGRAVFTVNPSGVKADALGQGSSGLSTSWDPIWEAATLIDELGWTAEIRIPLSQLRFSRSPFQLWGMQITRFTLQKNELSVFAFWPKNETGGPSRYGHLDGLRVPAHPRRLEILPYVVARSRFKRPVDADNPFTSRQQFAKRVGADLKYLLSSNITLDATIAPDFGQVEVDPAVVNLTAFETFFPETRPFFIEGAGIFNFGAFACFVCGQGAAPLDLFYSRRIGRVPQGSTTGKYVDTPESSRILGAAKLTGRTAAGTSIGIINALTRAEHARVMVEAEPGGGLSELRPVVEPATNFFVGRLKRDFNAGNAVVGVMGTSVYRWMSDAALESRLARHAQSGGVDWNLAWSQRRYSLIGQFAASHIAGDPRAMLRAQSSSARYFQRPDKDSGSGLVDSAATGMGGYAGFTRLAKEGGTWLGEILGSVRSPGYETNDISFLTRTDHVYLNANLGGQVTRVTRFSRALSGGFGTQRQFNFDGDLLDKEIHGAMRLTFLNYWSMSTSVYRRPETLDDRLTRGGPVVRKPGYTIAYLNVYTDPRSRVSFGLNPNVTAYEQGLTGYSASVTTTLKPSSTMLFSLVSSYGRTVNPTQYVTAAADPTATSFHGRRYIFAELDQRTLAIGTRVNVTFSPTTSFELYAQPFISAARYSNFSEYLQPREAARHTYVAEEITTSGSGAALTHELHTGPGTSVVIRNPDFNYRSLRGNAVFRWEYRPGSTLFVVWQQSREDTVAHGEFSFSRDRAALFATRPDNIFLVKVNYWLGT